MLKKKPVIAIFDFDGTLTKGDTLLPFLFHCFGKWKVIFGLIYTSPYILGYVLHLISNHKAKGMIINYFFKKQKIDVIEKYGIKFVDEKIDRYLRPNIINRLRWHQNSGHLTVLISASLEVYFKSWAKKYSFNHAECTKLQTNADEYTGRILGKNCYGNEKVNRLFELFGNKLSNYEIYGYGDGRGDQKFLEKCEFKFYKKDLNSI